MTIRTPEVSANTELPLQQVIAEATAKNARLRLLDSEIYHYIQRIEQHLRAQGVQRIVFVPFEDVKLAWSGARRNWRLVVVDDHDDTTVPLLGAARDVRVEVFASGAMSALVERMRREGLLKH